MNKTLNLDLILKLSLFGLVMAIATVFVVPSTIEPLFWLVIFVACAILIARSGVPKPFVHGFLVSLANCVWITTAHIVFVSTYLANHPDEAAMLAKMPSPDSPRLMMAMTGPLFGVAFGLVLGLFAFIASKFVKAKASA
jgi:hypothetical protein